jgi:hypothetical protein
MFVPHEGPSHPDGPPGQPTLSTSDRLPQPSSPKMEPCGGPVAAIAHPAGDVVAARRRRPGREVPAGDAVPVAAQSQQRGAGGPEGLLAAEDNLPAVT